MPPRGGSSPTARSRRAVTCPLHFWEFDLRTGEYADDTSTRIRTYETKVVDGRVCVKI